MNSFTWALLLASIIANVCSANRLLLDMPPDILPCEDHDFHGDEFATFCDCHAEPLPLGICTCSRPGAEPVRCFAVPLEEPKPVADCNTAEAARCNDDCRNCIPCIKNPFLPWCDDCSRCEECLPYVSCVMEDVNCEDPEIEICASLEFCPEHCLDCVFHPDAEGCNACESCLDHCEKFVPCVETTQMGEAVACDSEEAHRCSECEVCIPCIESPWLPWCENEDCTRCKACERFAQPCVLADQDCNNHHVHGCYDCIKCTHCLFDHEHPECESCGHCAGCTDTISCATEPLLSTFYLTQTGDCEAPEAACVADCINCIPCHENPFLPWCADTCEQCDTCKPFYHCYTDDLRCEEAEFCGEVCGDHCAACINSDDEHCESCSQCFEQCGRFIPCLHTTQNEPIDCFSEEVNNCRENCFECSACLGDPTLPWCRDSCHQCKVCERFVEPCLIPLLDCESEIAQSCGECVDCLECEFHPDQPFCSECTECRERCHRFIPCIRSEDPTDLPRCEEFGFLCGDGGCDIDDCCGTPWAPWDVKDCCHSWPCDCEDWESKDDCTCSHGHHEERVRCNGSRHEHHCGVNACPEMHCPMGRKHDEHGCETCECIEPCPEVRCAIDCPFGYRKNEHGCDTCECQPELPRCEDFGFFCGEGGCDVDDCCGTPWAPWDVKECCHSWPCHCEDWETKEDCTCSRDQREHIRCDGSKHELECPHDVEVACDRDCPFGLQHDRHGCEICVCIEGQQIVKIEPLSPTDVDAGEHFEMRVWYDTFPMNYNHVVGVGVVLNFPQGLELIGHNVEFEEGLFGNVFNSENTITFQYADIHSAWPAVDLPLSLTQFTFRVNDDFEGGEIEVEFSSTAAGFEGAGYGLHMSKRYHCPEIMCPALHCEHGRKHDEHGCETCECEEYHCPPIMCPALHCEHGRKHDEHGCEVCECEEFHCPPIMCPALHCEHGRRHDEHGCETCECEEFHFPCPAFHCDLHCQFGRRHDGNGCEMCECEELPEGDCAAPEASECVEDCKNCIPCMENPFLPWCQKECQNRECERCLPFVHCVMEEINHCEGEEIQRCGEICEDSCVYCVFDDTLDQCGSCGECLDQCEKFVPCVSSTQNREVDCQSEEVQNCQEHCEHCVPCIENPEDPGCEHCDHCSVCERFIEPCLHIQTTLPPGPHPINLFEKAKERTFVLIKPDGVERGLVGEIMTRFEHKGFSNCGTKMLTVDEGFAQQNYPWMANHLASGPVVAFCWQGLDAVAEAQVLMGAEDPEEAGMGTIRGTYAMSPERNVIYGSESYEKALLELRLWFPEGLVEFYPTRLKHVYEF